MGRFPSKPELFSKKKKKKKKKKQKKNNNNNISTGGRYFCVCCNCRCSSVICGGKEGYASNRYYSKILPCILVVPATPGAHTMFIF